jgi:dihydroorotase-like cyclic amidohydrolase
MAVDLARRHGSRLHILHLTTARELDLFQAGSDPKRHRRGGAVFFNERGIAKVR